MQQQDGVTLYVARVRPLARGMYYGGAATVCLITLVPWFIPLFVDDLIWLMVPVLSTLANALLVAILLLVARPRFVVRVDGIRITGMLGSRWIPWEKVHAIEVDMSEYRRGGVLVLLRDGRRAGSRITSASAAWLRGEDRIPVGSLQVDSSRPVREARAAHIAHLHGRATR